MPVYSRLTTMTPLAFLLIDGSALFNRLIWSIWINAEPRSRIKPIQSATQPQPFRRDDAYVARCKALTQRTRVELADALVGQSSNPLIPFSLIHISEPTRRTPISYA